MHFGAFCRVLVLFGAFWCFLVLFDVVVNDLLCFLLLFALVHTSLPGKKTGFSPFKAVRARPHESAKEKFKDFRFFEET